MAGVEAEGSANYLILLLFYGYTVESQSKHYGRAGEMDQPGKCLLEKHGALSSHL